MEPVVPLELVSAVVLVVLYVSPEVVLPEVMELVVPLELVPAVAPAVVAPEVAVPDEVADVVVVSLKSQRDDLQR
jgi:hypothetical protein